MKGKIIYILIGLLFIGLITMLYIEKKNNDFKGENNIHQVIEYEDLKKLKQEKDVIIVDVRSSLEFNEGHIKDAVNIPIGSIDNADDIKELLPNKDAFYVIYCQSGNRSKTVTEMLIDAGYKNTYDFGSIENWKDTLE